MTNAMSTTPVNTSSSRTTLVDCAPSRSVTRSTSIRPGVRPSLVVASDTNAPYGLPVSVVIALSSLIAVVATSPDFAFRLMPTGAENETGSLPQAATRSGTKATKNLIVVSDAETRLHVQSDRRYEKSRESNGKSRPRVHGWNGGAVGQRASASAMLRDSLDCDPDHRGGICGDFGTPSSGSSQKSPLSAVKTWTWMCVAVGLSNAPIWRPIQSRPIGSKNSGEPHVLQNPRRTFSDERYHVTCSPPRIVTTERGASVPTA